MAAAEVETRSACSITSLSSPTPKKSVKQESRFSIRRLLHRPKRKKPSREDDASITPSNVPNDAEAPVSFHIEKKSKRKSGNGKMECPLCLMERPKDQFPDIMTCHHRSCQECLRQYLKIEITESRVNIACPECAEHFHPNDIRMVLNDDIIYGKYEEFTLRRLLVTDPDARWCPAPDCGYVVIAAGCASCPKLTCRRPGCHTNFCYHCKQIWHPNQTCDMARQQRLAKYRTSSVSVRHSISSGLGDDIKPCPRCSAFIVKMDDGSCNHMTCAVCGAEFCWLCMKEISDLHYLSPSGCTFWGKKPWSRKKKILWQLGTLVGAPVGIALVAGIAIPAMIIGIPVYVGKKIHGKYEGKNISKHKRNLAITGGVTLSIIVSPVLAALTVGIGVPIMLAYVYGVVPISLCRSGGCGVTTSDGGGVRIEFDDENDVTVGVTGTFSGDQSAAEVNSAVVNPSIGEASVGGLTGSLSASGSHMDRVGIIRDSDTVSDSASTRAIAGASITGSLSGSVVAGPSGIGQNRMETNVDVANNRNSISSESTSMGMADNSSTNTGASCQGSSAPAPVEVHVDVLERKTKSRHSSGNSSLAETTSHPYTGEDSTDDNISRASTKSQAGKSSFAKGSMRHSSMKKSSVKISEPVREEMRPRRGSFDSTSIHSYSSSSTGSGAVQSLTEVESDHPQSARQQNNNASPKTVRHAPESK
ncbi:E3 ubiquitin-protein ligase RNF19A-like [Ptychodera flava]|uniref:E3 ubiquitin-protein ligase RNF19A-like n=1 Tax=Ptychodera flava TaxID=63121 RepID=UPI00396A0A51